MSVIIPMLRRTRLITKGYRIITIRKYCAGGDPCAEKKGLILGVYEGDTEDPIFSPAAKKFDEHLSGKLFELMKSLGPEAYARGSCRTFNNLDKEFWAVAIVGLGREKQGYCEMEAIDEGMEAVRVASALGARALRHQGVARILCEGLGYPEQAGEGTTLALWKFQENKNKEKWVLIQAVELFDDPDQESFQRGVFKAECQNLARRLTDTPANQMTPLHFAQETVNELCPCGIKVEVHDKDWIETRKFNCFLTVARGSCEPPVLLEISYCGGPPDMKPIMMAGKGITFDSGGLCLKQCDNMLEYRGDMSGAAAIVAAIKAAAALSLPVNITAIIPLCENMPSGMAMKCGDVIMGMNGKSIMITNTDHEGRIVLADALVYGQCTYKPRLIIDVATLTYGVRSGLGAAAAGVFCNSQTLWSQVRKAGVITGDRVWRLPLWRYFTRRVIDFTSHDVDNKGMGTGTPCLGAAFLNEFVNCIDWIHFDITGVGMMCNNKVYPYYAKGRMTGRPTRCLIQLLYQLSCPSEGNRELK